MPKAKLWTAVGQTSSLLTTRGDLITNWFDRVDEITRLHRLRNPNYSSFELYLL
jgi:predicted ferric reductase